MIRLRHIGTLPIHAGERLAAVEAAGREGDFQALVPLAFGIIVHQHFTEDVSGAAPAHFLRHPPVTEQTRRRLRDLEAHRVPVTNSTSEDSMEQSGPHLCFVPRRDNAAPA